MRAYSITYYYLLNVAYGDRFAVPALLTEAVYSLDIYFDVRLINITMSLAKC